MAKRPRQGAAAGRLVICLLVASPIALSAGLAAGQGALVSAVVEDITALATAPLRMDGRDALMAGAAVAVVGATFAADKSARRVVRHNTTSSGLDVADGFSRFGSPAGLLALNAGVIGIGTWRESSVGDRRLKEAGWISLEAEVFAVVATLALKQIIGRSRPGTEQGATTFRPLQSDGGATSPITVFQEVTSPVRQKSSGQFRPFGGSGSFPSSHASASFAVAAVFADRFEASVGWVSYGFASAVAASRVYSDDHFLSDVVAGSLLGWGMGQFLSRRHPPKAIEWQVRPFVLEYGANAGLLIGKEF